MGGSTSAAKTGPLRRERSSKDTELGLRSGAELDNVGGRLVLLLVGDGLFATHALPAEGEVVIGRGEQADIELDDATLSRVHARLHLGATLQVEDVGSVHGTFVRGSRLDPGERVHVRVNEAIQLGAITALVQPRSPARRGRQLHAHAYFEMRLDDECARMRRSGGPFGVLHVATRGRGEGGERAEAAPSIIAACLRAEDVVAVYAPGELELLVVDATAEVLAHVAERIEAALAAHDLAARVGSALHPGDGRDASSLLAVARERAVGAARTADAAVVIVDDRMRALHALVARVADADISVLLLGETGVGKEVIAETIHRLSPRAGKPFLRLNCAALTESLLESELFGHERGAFTGALATKPGLLEVAEQGVVFLDEVGELPLSTQVKLLRVLDERKVTRVGSVKPRAIDVRVIAATNRDLEADVQRGAFRLDLYFRLNAMSVVIPPLRERVAEIAPLARHFAAELARAARKPAPRIASDVIAALEGYAWPGNVRELRNTIERALVLCTGDELTLADLPLDRMRTAFTGPPPAAVAAAGAPVGSGRAAARGDYARIVATLDACGGNQTHAAQLLGVSRRTLVTWIEKHGIRRPRKR